MVDIEFIVRFIFQLIGIICFFNKYQEINYQNSKKEHIFFSSVLCSVAISVCFLFLYDYATYLGICIWLLLIFFLFLANRNKLMNIVFFNSFFVTFVFYIYMLIGIGNRAKYVNATSLSYSKFIFSLYIFMIIFTILINVFKIQFILPNGEISIFIVCVSISLLFLELLFFDYIYRLSINNILSIIIYIIIGILFFCYNIIIQYLYNDYYQLTMISQNNFISKITDSYINGIQKEQEKVYKIKHDIKNNLIILQHLINNGKIEDANKILQEINQNLEYKKSDIYTGNIFIDAYLTNIINTSKIDIQMKCSDLKDMHYKPDVLSIIINLVDNAVENASSRVNLYIKYEDKNNILIKVSNDCENDPTKLLKKSKKKGDHGYGLRIVKDIVNKYKGTYLTSYENYIFTTYVVINVEDKNEK